jgi:hypothetical protein
MLQQHSTVNLLSLCSLLTGHQQVATSMHGRQQSSYAYH